MNALKHAFSTDKIDGDRVGQGYAEFDAM
jgi:hypothetical protein